jgi:hypothetical protein
MTSFYAPIYVGLISRNPVVQDFVGFGFDNGVRLLYTLAHFCKISAVSRMFLDSHEK